MRKADNLPPSCAVVTKSGSLNFLEPSGPVQACNGTALPFTFIYIFIHKQWLALTEIMNLKNERITVIYCNVLLFSWKIKNVLNKWKQSLSIESINFAAPWILPPGAASPKPRSTSDATKQKRTNTENSQTDSQWPTIWRLVSIRRNLTDTGWPRCRIRKSSLFKYFRFALASRSAVLRVVVICRGKSPFIT